MKKNTYLLAGLCAICLNASAQQTTPLPSAEAVGLTHIVPDMLLWFHTNNYFTNGPIIGGVADTNSTIWDCYISPLGDSTFVLTSLTFATNNSPLPPYPGSAANGWQCFALAFQPAAGGAPTLGYAFYDDYGRPYLKRISQRQTGNPGRVAADKRYGAVNFITGAQANVGYTSYTDTNFTSNSRWTANYNQSSQRYAFEQIFSFNPTTQTQTPLTLASDFPQLGATVSPNTVYGDVLALDNGNFALIYDDNTHLFNVGEDATVTIVGPDGSIIKPPFSVDTSTSAGLWANCAAYRGGFCVRWAQSLYFFDNSGNPKGSVNQISSFVYPNFFSFDTGRGDATRLASDIHSHYVYLAGANGGGNPVTGFDVVLGIWDANTTNFVTATNVTSDIDITQMKINAVNVAVDALDRITVAWDCEPNTDFFNNYQTVARVMKFDGTNISFLTPSFYPFVNHDPVGTNVAAGMHYQTPGVAMTTRQICISAKGQVNSTNNPAGGPDTPYADAGFSAFGGVNFYTVLSHPAPVAPPRPELTIQESGADAIISWPYDLVDYGIWTLQSSPTLSPASWSPVGGVVVSGSTAYSTNALSGKKYFRLARY